MLVSQRVAWDMKFLKVGPYGILPKMELRQRILQSVKVLVGMDLLDLHTQMTMEESLRKLMKSDKGVSQVYKRRPYWKKFAKPPFPTMLLENETGALLVLSPPDAIGIYIVMIRSDGTVTPWAASLKPEEIEEDLEPAKRDGSFIEKGVQMYIGQKWPVEMEEQLFQEKRAGSVLLGYMVYEILLFFNTKNITRHVYTPQKKEMGAVPRVLHPSYVYRVLDVYRDRKEFTSMADIKEFLNPPDHVILARRAGLVRGHFKERTTGVFWWDMFVRNKKNAETVGVVDKDYSLRSDTA